MYKKTNPLKNTISLIFLLPLLLLATNLHCRKNKCLKNAGRTTTVSRSVTPFEYLVLDGNFTAYIYSDTIPSLQITTGENLVEDIQSYMSGDTLIIKDQSQCDFLKGYEEKKIKLAVDSPDYICLKNNASLYSQDTIYAEHLILESLSELQKLELCLHCFQLDLHTGIAACNYILTGKMHYLYVLTNLHAKVDACGLQVENVLVDAGGHGDCCFTASNQLHVCFDNTGDVYYTGNPDTIIIERSQRGTGQLIHWNEK
ncbi:MAG: hypothetical protein CSB06_01320 [Bacteroidia bacterium]|nr:MAG: hypothetical protein CSB06_01320 [Bacteroidia bacterium]